MQKENPEKGVIALEAQPIIRGPEVTERRIRGRQIIREWDNTSSSQIEERGGG